MGRAPRGRPSSSSGGTQPDPSGSSATWRQTAAAGWWDWEHWGIAGGSSHRRIYRVLGGNEEL